MNTNQRVVAHIMFQNKVLRANGSRYEELFTDVMTRRYPRFEPVRPYGTAGDRKNDGFIKPLGRYFQVYAPHEPSFKANESASKAQRDFAGLLAFWDEIAPVREYFFVFNDKFEGSNPPLEMTLAQIQRDHALDDCGAFLSKDLVNEFDALEDHLMGVVIGSLIPNAAEISGIDYGAITNVIEHVMNSQQPVNQDVVLVAPDFDAKLQMNQLPDPVAALLRVGNYQAGAVERYFDTHGEFSRGVVRDYFAQAYEEAKAVTTTPEQAFFYLLEATTPVSPSTATEKQLQDATLVLIAYFFETCDVFEEPGT